MQIWNVKGFYEFIKKKLHYIKKYITSFIFGTMKIFLPEKKIKKKLFSIKYLIMNKIYNILYS